MPNPSHPHQPILTYLHLLAGYARGKRPPAESPAFLELRYRRDRQAAMGVRYYPVTDASLRSMAAMIAKMGPHRDVYVAAAPRQREAGTREAVAPSWVVWADCDTPQSTECLAGFVPAPTLVVATSRVGRHALYALSSPLDVDQVEAANRRLALALAADPAVFDAPRILRPPGTFNHKAGRLHPVTLDAHQPQLRYAPAELLEQLPELPPGPPPTPAHAAIAPVILGRGGDRLLELEPAIYVHVLTGLSAGRDGKLPCPLRGHADRTPSFHVYPTAEQGVWCFGCRRGGSIFDFAAALWGLQTRGPDFVELRRRLQERFGIDASNGVTAGASGRAAEPGSSPTHRGAQPRPDGRPTGKGLTDTADAGVRS